ncbi:MAG: ATP-grasp domain-containing protein [Candidatus Thorarchaeota archaeon]
MNIRALVLGNDSRSTLAVVRSLGRSGITVDIGSSERKTPSRYSRYVNVTYLLPDPMNSIERWTKALKVLLSKNKYDIVIPASEVSVIPIIREYEELSKLCLVALPEPDTFLRTLRKDKTLELARICNVPTPKSRLAKSMKDVDEAIINLTIPIVQKPVSSKIGIHDEQLSFRVRYAKDANELTASMDKLLKFTPVLLQEKVSGKGIGQEFLTKNGEILAMFQHERIHEPFGGGGSSYRKSTAIDSELLEYSKRMIAELGWTGVLMVEYKSDATTGENWLMEINGRFWGSLPLAIAAGADFPKQLVEMHVMKEEVVQPNYMIGTRCRNFLLDIGWAVRRIMGAEKGARRLEGIKQIFHIPVKLLANTDRSDTFVRDDMAPGFMELFSFFEHTIREKLFTLLLAYRRWRYVPTSNISENRIKAVNRIRDANSVLFFCKGNICRSPFAEHAFRKILSEHGLTDVRVGSAGRISREGRRSPAAAVANAAEFGLNLDNHRSRKLTQLMLDECGVIFVMDASEYLWIKNNFKDANDKLFFLGEFHEGEVIEIDDPWRRSYQTFHRVYNCITGILQNVRVSLLEVASID